MKVVLALVGLTAAGMLGSLLGVGLATAVIRRVGRA